MVWLRAFVNYFVKKAVRNTVQKEAPTSNTLEMKGPNVALEARTRIVLLDIHHPRQGGLPAMHLVRFQYRTVPNGIATY